MEDVVEEEGEGICLVTLRYLPWLLGRLSLSFVGGRAGENNDRALSQLLFSQSSPSLYEHVHCVHCVRSCILTTCNPLLLHIPLLYVVVSVDMYVHTYIILLSTLC